jgi:hypothetical protein
MNKELLAKHVRHYVERMKTNPAEYERDAEERHSRCQYYQDWTAERLAKMSADDFAEYLPKLWAMQIWGNKQYVVDKILGDNGLEVVTNELSQLLWGAEPVAERWARFRKHIKWMGPAMMSELLCYTHPQDYMVWNRRAYVALNYLGIVGLPRYDYQMTGKKYVELSEYAKQIAEELATAGVPDTDLLVGDYFIWSELQVEDVLQGFHGENTSPRDEPTDSEPAEFIHNEVRDKIAEIGRWLGFEDHTEVKVASGSVVDTVWEASIGNMGRVIYVFEVQTKGSVDSLILNLLKSLNNPAVQGVVAVSDAKQLDKIQSHAESVQGLKDKLKYWDYQEVLQVHERLASVNESINSLGLVPHGFS